MSIKDLGSLFQSPWKKRFILLLGDLSGRTRNRFEGGVLRISSIFKWYRRSFEKKWRGAHNPGQFLALYRHSLGLPVDTANRLVAGDIAIEFLNDDRRLNATTRGKP